jgi:hypothetical protein
MTSSNESKIDCSSCCQDINEKHGYYEIEVTDWEDDSGGTSETFYYHRDCYKMNGVLR